MPTSRTISTFRSVSAIRLAVAVILLVFPLTSGADTRPDLTIQGLRLAPAAPRARDAVTATVTELNAGTGPSNPASVALYFAPSSETPLARATPVGSVMTPPLLAGASALLPVTLRVPDVAPGSFRIFAVVDAPGLIAETNDTNNRRSAELRVTFPDLTLRDLRLTPAAARARDAVTATVTVRNAGAVPADPASIAVYFAQSSDTPIERATLLGTVTTPQLPAGASVPLPVRFQVPNVAPGSFRILALVDGTGVLAETNDTNNRRSTELRVTFPDLTLSGLSLAPSVARARDPVTATVTVRNVGAVPAAPASVALYFARSSETPLELATALGTVMTPVLPAGAAAPLPVTFRIPDVAPGSFRVFAVIDAPALLSETNDANNRRSTELRVALPDLRVDTLGLSPSLTRPGDVIATTVRVKNGGSVPSGAAKGALFVVANGEASLQAVAPAATFDIPVLGPGKTVAAKVSMPVPVLATGSYYVVAKVDSSLAIGESSETNNARTARFEVAVPDVSVDDLTVAPSVVQPGQVVAAGLRFGNAGRVTSHSTTAVVFLGATPDAPLPTGPPVATLPVDSIPAHGSLRLTVPVTVPMIDPGAYYLIAQLDASTAIGPWSGMLTSAASAAPATKVRRKAVKLVLQMPDLIVSELSLDSTQLRPGTTMNAVFTVKNVGSATAASTVAALLFGGCASATPTTLKTTPVPSLGPGASTRLTATATVPAASPGTQCVTARADANRAVAEAIESNNDRSTSITIRDLNVTLEPHVDPSELDVPYSLHSHYKHPWRAWLETMPASAYLDGVGLNYHIDTPRVHDDIEMRLLAESGIARIRVEVPWGRTDYNTLDLLPEARASLVSILNAAKASGIRPLILLNGHHGNPVPHLEIKGRTVSATASAGARSVQLSDVTGVSPGYTGLSHLTDYKMAEVIITAVNPSTRTVTLSKPLPVTLRAGQSVKLDTLRFQPLAEPGTPAFDETANGFVQYARAVMRAVMATGITTFDVEYWNELTFGSDFLGINNYYNPHIMPDADPFRPGMRVWEMGRRLVTMLTTEFPNVTPIWGVSNTLFFHVGVTELPAGMRGQSYHPYVFAEYESFADEQHGFGYNMEQFAPQAPPYRVVMPEGAGMFIKTDSLIRHINPWARGRKPPSSPDFNHYLTEYGFSPQAYGVTDVDEAALLKAKALLRSSFFWLNKGIRAVWFFGDYLEYDLTRYDLLPRWVAQLATYPADPKTALTLPLEALGNAARELKGATPLSSVRQLQADVSAADGEGGGIIFRGDASHPDLTYQDALAIFPFQVNPRTFVVALYVMSRNILEQLPETQFIIRFSNVDGRAAKLRYFDPLTGTLHPVDVIEATSSTLLVSVPVSDSPYLLTIAE